MRMRPRTATLRGSSTRAKRALGLEAGQVSLSPYSAEWPAAFESERGRLEEALGGLAVEIEHVGSTAVPGLAAKPIIDIAVSTDLGKTASRIKQTLLECGYAYLVDAGDNGGHIFYRETAPGIRSYHLHVIDRGDVQWHNYLLFRNRMRRDERKRNEYGTLKAELAAAYPHDRDSYTEAKSSFISRTIGEMTTEQASPRSA